jgi:lactoylglutathione lyase
MLVHMPSSSAADSDYVLDHVVIYAHDLNASVRFYADVLGVLGFEKTRDHVFGREGLFFDLRQAQIEGPAHARGRPGVDHFGFEARERAAVDRFASHLRALDHPCNLIEFDDGDYALFLTDPDGLRIEITWYPPAR